MKIKFALQNKKDAIKNVFFIFNKHAISMVAKKSTKVKFNQIQLIVYKFLFSISNTIFCSVQCLTNKRVMKQAIDNEQMLLLQLRNKKKSYVITFKLLFLVKKKLNIKNYQEFCLIRIKKSRSFQCCKCTVRNKSCGI